MPLSLKISLTAVMSLVDSVSVGGIEPARNPIALNFSLELFDASV